MAKVIDLKLQLAAVKGWEWARRNTEDAAILNAIEESLKRLQTLDKAAAPVKPKYERYQDFIDLYYEWHVRTKGVKPRMTAAGGRAMNAIIACLLEQDKVEDESGALASWTYILLHWDQVGKWLATQTTLTKINTHLQEILTKLRNHGRQADTSTKGGRNRLAAREATRRNHARRDRKHRGT